MYEEFHRIQALYDSLMDERSKQLFLARLAYDLEPSKAGAARLMSFYSEKGMRIDKEADTALHSSAEKQEELNTFVRQHEKVIIYGTSRAGRAVASFLTESALDFSAFCGRKYKQYTNGKLLQGKPVVSPDWVIEHRSECGVIIGAGNQLGHLDEILGFLVNQGFPREHIITPFLDVYLHYYDEEQYYEFPELYEPGGAFVDGGCFNGNSSVDFARWCGGNYSKIYAFEPDPVNQERCRRRFVQEQIARIELIPAGLSDKTGTALMNLNGDTSTSIAEKPGDTAQSTPVAALDDVLKDEKCGFIKMDIEGSEYAALRGAAKVIVRDRPLLAICVYHKPGDTLAIMELLSKLVPDYHFWLRQYYMVPNETVLYASVKTR